MTVGINHPTSASDNTRRLDRIVSRDRNRRAHALHRSVVGPVTTTADLGQQHVMLALMRKALVIERLENNLHLLFEQLAIAFWSSIGAPKVSTSRV